MTGETKIRTYGDWESQKELEYKGMQDFSKNRTTLTDTGFLFSSLSCSYIHPEVSYPFCSPGEKEEPLNELIAVTVAPLIQSSMQMVGDYKLTAKVIFTQPPEKMEM